MRRLWLSVMVVGVMVVLGTFVGWTVVADGCTLISFGILAIEKLQSI